MDMLMVRRGVGIERGINGRRKSERKKKKKKLVVMMRRGEKVRGFERS